MPTAQDIALITLILRSAPTQQDALDTAATAVAEVIGEDSRAAEKVQALLGTLEAAVAAHQT